MQLVRLNGYVPAELTTYEVEVSDADAASSGRGENGVMSRDRVRGGDNPIYTLSLGWQAIRDEEMRDILEAVKGITTTVTFYFGEQKTLEMYASNRKLKLSSAPNGRPLWDLSFTLTQF